MTDSDEEISISQNSKNHTGMRKLRLRNQVRIKLFHIIVQLTLHSDDKLCVQGFQNVFAYGCPDRGRKFDKK